MGEALLAVLPGKGRSGAWRPPPQAPDLFLFRLNMDNIFVDQALKAYRDRTEDMRLWESLPVAVTSQILREAQRLKASRSSGISQLAAADGWVDT
jgi:hypothetical protein